MRAAAGDFWSGLALAGLGAYIVAQAWSWEYIGADGPEEVAHAIISEILAVTRGREGRPLRDRGGPIHEPG